VPVSHLKESVPLQRPFRVRLGHGSFETKMLHGPLDVWTGVKDDIDWRVLSQNRQERQ
jgi:hypothetical protein